MAITTNGHTKLKNMLLNLIKEGQYTLDGKKYKTPLFKTELSGDIITIYLYLDDNVSGKITRFELLDQDGDTFDDQPDNITKPNINGLLISFKYSLKRV
ncbi:hypothetical protein MXL46_08140 [Heyndrickxia sporothermodurans]|uniref:Uncharacterized protein n=1 Tax=Heyndrickxia sporothermodurans TaxID=46224 RepID=A0AB37HEN4_9BACI|nr:hypothetical protein [Heyndrickxia sporothermodurans]MBL5768232.1 hypothetical protein [Heyndrickxia sporothermodurans]MBL5771011.1 hypothetical protein [Heyndrickxia sporothermodurans]MBL5774693.1 hypothetical protein [Heyndrickxia sporothermodurans]MBL5778113.1 hypothetical protein [Heyndrickxia sporothermodurans]MBL5785386.1 hypothetical protein [Heyndrickxia sporothermodurans]